MDIFCSTSQRSNALQKSSNDIFPWPHWSASIIVRSAMLINWSWLMFAPTIMCNIFNSSSREIDSSSSKSYIRNATENESQNIDEKTKWWIQVRRSATHISISPHECWACWDCFYLWVGSVPGPAWICGNWRGRRCCRRRMHERFDRTVDWWPIRECVESHRGTAYRNRCDPTT